MEGKKASLFNFQISSIIDLISGAPMNSSGVGRSSARNGPRNVPRQVDEDAFHPGSPEVRRRFDPSTELKSGRAHSSSGSPGPNAAAPRFHRPQTQIVATTAHGPQPSQTVGIAANMTNKVAAITRTLTSRF